MPSAFAMSLSVAFSFSLTSAEAESAALGRGISDFAANCAQPHLEGRRLCRSLGVQKSRDLTEGLDGTLADVALTSSRKSSL